MPSMVACFPIVRIFTFVPVDITARTEVVAASPLRSLRFSLTVIVLFGATLGKGNSDINGFLPVFRKSWNDSIHLFETGIKEKISFPVSILKIFTESFEGETFKVKVLFGLGKLSKSTHLRLISDQSYFSVARHVII